MKNIKHKPGWGGDWFCWGSGDAGLNADLFPSVAMVFRIIYVWIQVWYVYVERESIAYMVRAFELWREKPELKNRDVIFVHDESELGCGLLTSESVIL